MHKDSVLYTSNILFSIIQFYANLMKKATYALFIFLLLASGLSAQNSFFEVVSPRAAPTPVEVVKNIKNFSIVRLNEPAMRAYLLNAPMEFQNNGMTLPLEIPLPNGKTEIFGIVESPILSREVAAQHPEIKTYTGNGLTNKKAIIRLSLTSDGFNAILLNVEGDAVYFQKYSEQSRDVYFTYFTREVVVPQNGTKTKSCSIGLHEEDHDHDHDAVTPNQLPEMMMVGAPVTLKTFRLALAANGEFTAEHGGTQAGSFATVVGYVNRMTALFRRDLGVNFTLVSGINLIYINPATDPYTNNDQIAMLEENHNNCNAVIGNTNYDIGHVWGYTGGSGGGIAASPSVCNTNFKGEGVSGEGDLGSYAQVFMDQLLFHEVGHQFGMSHSYNSTIPVCTTRNPGTSVEPGAGTTVMSYGFTCDTDDYFSTNTPQTGPILQFHAASLAQANAYMAASGNCFSSTATGNTSPDVTGPSNFTIPKSTPFALTGSATDVNSDAMTFCWEGMNTGTMTPNANTLTDLTQPPFFRSYGIPDSSAATRTYPLLSAILNGTNNAKGDKLPSVGIATTHRLTVRDNNAAGGGVSFADVTVTVNGAIGPFLETTNLGGSYAALSTQTITWSVNGTNTATPNIKISLSTDGGLTFPITLLASTANDGSELVTLPNNPTTTARIKVEAVGNIFFDISNVNFTITPAAAVTCPANSAVCVNAPAFALTGGMPAGGTYSGTGVSAGMFNPATAGVGMHTITYTNGTTCTFVITVNALPAVTCPANSAVCVNAPAFALAGGSPGGGTYSGTGVSAGMFNPASAGVGMHTITYSSTDGNGCTNTCTFVITVNAAPTVTCPANSAAIVTDPAFALTGGSPGSGTYTGTGVSAGMFNPATAGVGMHTITYSYTNGNGCTNTCTFVITVNAAPTVTCPANSAVCINAPAFALTGGAPAGGTYSGTGVSAGMFNPATAGVGMHTLTYTNGGTCTFVITVNALPVVTCPANATTCINTPAFALTGGSPAGGTYSGTGVSAGMFNPATAGTGPKTITYTYTDGNGCTNSCTYTITVSALPTPVITGQNVVCTGGNVTLDAGAGYSSYAWSHGGGSGQTATFSNILATTTYSVTVTNAAGCSGTASFTVTKDNGELPSAWSNSNVGSANGSASFSPCSGDGGTFTLSATGFSTSSSDVIHASYQQICGNTEVIARVLTVSGGGWAGVMVRETLAQGSKKVSMKTQLSTNIRREIRSVTNGAATILNYIRPQHTWLRLVRSGNNIVGYSSIDGTTWNFAFTATVSMTGCVYVGIFSESINNSVTNTATFDNVSVTGAPAPLVGNFPVAVLAESGDHVQVYPNPTTGEVNINLDIHAGKPGVIQVFNTLGELVMQERLIAGNPETHNMRISNGAGVYTVVIQLDDQRIVRRVVVNPNAGE